MQPLKITNEIRGNVRSDIEDFEFRKEKSKSGKHYNDKKDLKRPKNQNHKDTEQFIPSTFRSMGGNSRNDFADIEEHIEGERDDIDYRKIHSHPSKNGRYDLRKLNEFSDDDIDFRQIKLFNPNNLRKELVRSDIDDISEFSFRKIKPDSAEVRAKKNKVNKDNNRRIHAVKNNEIVGYTRRDMEDIYP
ncbi:hypothetical protein K502DRAFT_333885 [Neoconidiobolus thromboides FSU 785]|nr:hypothetical protein K502DRAFT_333885 [Neoconidiobolus thromboides FSU 785]